MPKMKPAKKRAEIRKNMAVTEQENLRNRMIKSSVKTAVKKYEAAVASNSSDSAELYRDAIAAIDKAAGKGTLHKNAAARRKSRLAKKYAQA